MSKPIIVPKMIKFKFLRRVKLQNLIYLKLKKLEKTCKIRHWDKINLFVILLLMLINGSALAQAPYNTCANAQDLCPNETYTLTNIGANKSLCPGCEDDFTFCFTSNNSIWMKFTTNSAGGAVQVDFSNMVFETNPGQDTEIQATILSASVPCNAASYTALGNCVSNATTNFSLIAPGLAPNTTYYIVVDGDLNGAGITSAAECTFDVSISGAGVDRPTSSISLSSSAANICKNEIFTATATLIDCPDNGNFEWYVNNVLTAVTTSPSFQTTALNDGDVITVKTTCYLLCVDTIQNTLTPISVYSFLLSAGPDVSISAGQTVQLSGATTSSNFSWSPPVSISNTSSLNPFVFPSSSIIYTLTATENGCTLIDDVQVFVKQELNIPTTFSPNNDGINDTWVIEGIENYPNCLLHVYSRWGQEVFQSSGYNAGKAWDGTGVLGKLSEGVYFYTLELNDDQKTEKKGSITLIR